MKHVNSVSIQKRAIREQSKIIRSNYLEAEYRAKSNAVCGRLQNFVDARSFSSVMAYWPDVARREPDIRGFLADCFAAGLEVFLPAITDFASGKMEMRSWTPKTNMVANAWQIQEPIDSVGPGQLHSLNNLIVVPALAADEQGFRIGYGKGFYDRFLERQSSVSVTVVYDECLYPEVPSEPFDIPVGAVITEKRTFLVKSTSRNLIKGSS